MTAKRLKGNVILEVIGSDADTPQRFLSELHDLIDELWRQGAPRKDLEDSSVRLDADSGLTDRSCYAEKLQDPDLNPRRVEFVPCEAMPRRTGMGVVVIVPTFTEGEERDPPIVTRIIVGREPAHAPHVSGRIYQPRRMETENNA